MRPKHYAQERVPLVVVAGKMYGSGSSRDWAAKGPALLGIRGVLAESFERIHRSNLIGMGILPLQFRDGENAETLGLDGSERFTVEPVDFSQGLPEPSVARVTAEKEDGSRVEFQRRRARGHAHRRPLLLARRHPAVRVAPIAGPVGLTERGVPAGSGIVKWKQQRARPRKVVGPVEV